MKSTNLDTSPYVNDDDNNSKVNMKTKKLYMSWLIGNGKS